jgi:hypothetical protein
MNTAAWLPRRRAGTRQKTSVGTASRGIWFIRNANDLEGALRDLGAGAFADEMLVQDFVAGTTEKAQSVFCHGQMIGFHGYRQVMPGVGGGEAIKQSVRRPAVRAHLEKVGQALDSHGALSIDYIMPDDGDAALLIDCNPRLVEPFNAYRAGVDLVGLLLLISLGEMPAALPEGCDGVLTHLAMQALLGCAARCGTRREIARECLRLFANSGPYAGSIEETDAGRSGLDQRGAACGDGGIAAGCAEVSAQTRARRFWRASARCREYSDD